MPLLVPALPRLAPTADERTARDELRRQIARLERELANHEGGRPPLSPQPGSVSSRGGGRLLGIYALEVERDRLVGKLIERRAYTLEQACEHAAARTALEAMLADPPRHKFRRISRSALGLPGCGVYECRPRLGLVGMLAGWWEVKLSSGCP